MGTTRIKVIDLSSSQKEIKTSRKHARLAPPAEDEVRLRRLAERAEKLAGVPKLEKEEKEKRHQKPQATDERLASSAADENLVVTEHAEGDAENIEPESAIPAKSPLSKVAGKKKSARRRGSNYEKAKMLVEDKLYSAQEAFELLPKTSFVKFDPSVEIHVAVSEKSIRGAVSFPYFTDEKKVKRYLVFADKKPQTDVKNVIFANEKTIEDLESGKLKPGKDFDTVVAGPKFMPSLTKVAKILGPRGMMPNPKNGTVTDNFEKFLQDSASASTQFKSDPSSPVVHIKIGKLSQKPEELSQNMKAIILAIGHSKIKKAQITSTMGPAIRVDTASL
ncbi:MAG: hypothetical protein UY21_C0032G0003 [Microgenomates group bacterium GW2011_GWA1_48_10]|nr:MAG: hypothetical protein UY21_C0032G0003 [Microgenomates group bacterium GW2011_GWA1_48_10]